jgi:hypothetical protein
LIDFFGCSYLLSKSKSSKVFPCCNLLGSALLGTL